MGFELAEYTAGTLLALQLRKQPAARSA